MSPGLALVFWSLVLFEVKHFICDFIIQTRYQYMNKGIYGHPGGFIHAAAHATASIPAILILQTMPWRVGAIVAVEFLVHYHLDWSKEQITKRRGLTYSDALYWTLFGADQFMHQLTYVVILAVLARWANL
jgi:hypothetical protein